MQASAISSISVINKVNIYCLYFGLSAMLCGWLALDCRIIHMHASRLWIDKKQCTIELAMIAEFVWSPPHPGIRIDSIMHNMVESRRSRKYIS